MPRPHTPAAHTQTLRVYFEDTDAAGVVYYANYLRYLERARSDWLRALGFEQRALLALGTAFVVRAVAIEYLRPARLDDTLTVDCRLADLARVHMVCQQSVWRAEEELIRAEVRLVCINTATGRPRAIPETIVQLLEKIS